LQPEKIPEIPEDTARIARILFPNENRYMWLRDELGAIYNDGQFVSLYHKVGQLAEQPWRLAIMSIIQYMENYTDRQVAEAVKTRIDLKYALSLELTDPGCDFSVLSEFRSRLIKGNLEEVFLTTLLSICRERGWLKERGKQRTDSTHIEAAIRTMNRIECVGETLRAALNSLAVVVPDWLRTHVPQTWYDRYTMRMDEFRMPKEATKRQALAEQIGWDGWELLKMIRDVKAPPWLREIPAVEILRQVWIQQFWIEEGKLSFRSNDNIPPSSLLISSPYDTQAHLSIKRDTVWTGYKVHLTETCDDQTPHLIIHVETTPATTQDMEMTEVIHQELEHKQLLPSEHLMDTGYVDGVHIVTSKKQYGVELIGPVAINGSWQTKESQGFDNSQFAIDWENHVVTCPEGKMSKKWTVKQSQRGKEVIRAQFGQKDCTACPSRSQCTRAVVNPRQIVFRPQEQHEAIQATRKLQTTKDFKERYAKRSGIEGTISQGVRAFDLRVSRYLGIDKTHLQHVITATAMNVVRLFQWHIGDTPSQPRISRFAALAA
ncbi:MAG TPA: IS1182 family transposase, partial [Anaerolineales bacterium]|nr:IS1182 family transposase [Anaerolineales bacterium]